MNRSLYPTHWAEISRAIKERAGWTCEECGVAHGAHIIRNPKYPEEWRSADVKFPNLRRGEHVTRIFLTVHHKGVAYPDGSPGDPDDKMDNRPENLACLCQRCHLLADLESHQSKARETRIRKKHDVQVEAGQGELF